MERHYETDEVQNNDLDDFLNSFSVFWARYGQKLMIIITIVALSFAIYTWVKNRQTMEREQALTDFATATSPTNLRLVATTHAKRPEIATRAYRLAGDMSLREAMDLTLDDAARATALNDAKTSYQSAIDAAPAPVYRCNALLGLAATQEFSRDLEAAEATYVEVKVLAEQNHLPAHEAMANARIELLPELAIPVIFAPEPEPMDLSGDATLTPEIEIDPEGGAAESQLENPIENTADTPLETLDEAPETTTDVIPTEVNPAESAPTPEPDANESPVAPTTSAD